MKDTKIKTDEDVALYARNVKKKFCTNLKRSLYYGIIDLLRNLVGLRSDYSNLRKDEFWALNDLDLTVRKGETLGIIGGNGAGKTTLLRLLTGIYPPDVGEIGIRGRVGALIALGAGFHPQMTGLENIYLNGTILGMSRKEIEQRLELILDFAEIGEFIHAPVSTYSSGMRVRLGFAVASQLNPEILLVDEVLSVGDASFKERCTNWFDQYKERGGTVIFISHNMTVVEEICDRVIWLEKGRIEAEGDPATVIRRYEEKSLRNSWAADLKLQGKKAEPINTNPLQISSVEYFDPSGNELKEIEFGNTFEIRLNYEMEEAIEDPIFVLSLRKAPRHSSTFCTLSTHMGMIELGTLSGQGRIGCILRNPPLTPGLYYVLVGVARNLSTRFGEKWYYPMTECGSFLVTIGRLKEQHAPGVNSKTLVSHLPPLIIDHEWKTNSQNQEIGRSKLEA